MECFCGGAGVGVDPQLVRDQERNNTYLSLFCSSAGVIGVTSETSEPLRAAIGLCGGHERGTNEGRRRRRAASHPPSNIAARRATQAPIVAPVHGRVWEVSPVRSPSTLSIRGKLFPGPSYTRHNLHPIRPTAVCRLRYIESSCVLNLRDRGSADVASCSTLWHMTVHRSSQSWSQPIRRRKARRSGVNCRFWFAPGAPGQWGRSQRRI